MFAKGGNIDNFLIIVFMQQGKIISNMKKAGK